MTTAPASRYIPVAEYDIGLCHYGMTAPYKTVIVKADSLQVAMAAGRKLLKPSSVEHVRHVATRPNPEHVAMMEANKPKGTPRLGM